MERFSVVQGINPHSCAVQWRIIRADDSVFYLREELGGLHVSDIRAPEEDPEGGRTRRIELS